MQKESMQHAKYIRKSVKQVAIPCEGRHIDVTAAAAKLIFVLKNLQMYLAFCSGFWGGAGLGGFWCKAVYILIWYSVCGVVWCCVV